MEMQYGKNYRVVGSDDLFGEKTNGFIVTPLHPDYVIPNEDHREFVNMWGLTFPEENMDGWLGDFQILSVPETADKKFMEVQELEVGGWLCYNCVFLEEVD